MKRRLEIELSLHFLKGESLRDLVAQFKDSGLSRSNLYKLLLDVKGELDEE